jgi:hypothetical protein
MRLGRCIIYFRKTRCQVVPDNELPASDNGDAIGIIKNILRNEDLLKITGGTIGSVKSGIGIRRKADGRWKPSAVCRPPVLADGDLQ